LETQFWWGINIIKEGQSLVSSPARNGKKWGQGGVNILGKGITPSEGGHKQRGGGNKEDVVEHHGGIPHPWEALMLRCQLDVKSGIKD